MTEAEVAWVAGLLEGEGCFSLHPKGSQLRIQCQMTDQDVVEKLHRLTGIGRIYLMNCPSYQGKKPVHRWMAGRREEVLALLKEIRPHMGIRRGQQVDLMLKWAGENPLRINRERQHGTRSKRKAGCGCELCRAADKTYMKNWLATKG